MDNKRYNLKVQLLAGFLQEKLQVWHIVVVTQKLNRRKSVAMSTCGFDEVSAKKVSTYYQDYLHWHSIELILLFAARFVFHTY